MVSSLPFTVLLLNMMCSSTACNRHQHIFDDLPSFQQEFYASLPLLPQALLIETVWLLFHFVFYHVPVGDLKSGLPLRNGETLSYHMNALHAMITSCGGVAALHYFEIVDIAVLATMWIPLIVASIIIATVISVFVYVHSFRSKKVLLALGGNSGWKIYDFFVGRELNPRPFGLDVKFVCELRPGLIGWVVLCWGLLMKAVQLGTVGPELIALTLMQTVYVVDALWFESAILSTMDIAFDGFGFMLAFGDLTWVPFLYTLQSKYAVYNAPQLPTYQAVILCALWAVGYAVFRGANLEKDRFRRDPKDRAVKHLKVMKTSAGKSLIISGYWGICRHPNYVGDWLMTLAMSLLCGQGAVIPYFQPVYFLILLVHRQLRDEEQMLHKYGKKDWEAFCEKVPYRLIPGVY